MARYNYSKLTGKIVEVYKTKENFANAMGISATSLSKKLNNKCPFKQDEVSKAINLLDLSGENIMPYFFAVDVKDTLTNN